jgi:nucleoid DNA-binding protein
MEFYYVYLTTNNITDQQYVGDRTSYVEPEKDKYFGSGVEIKKALKDYKKKNFSRIILNQYENRLEAFRNQEKYIRFYKTHVSQGGYNVSWTGGTYSGGFQSEETKQKIGKANKGNTAHLGKYHSAETKQNLSNINLGKHHTEETKQKMSKPRSEEAKQKMKGRIPWNKGMKTSEEIKQKISISKRGFHHSEETKKKLKKARIGRTPNLGKKHSIESKQKIGFTLKNTLKNKIKNNIK